MKSNNNLAPIFRGHVKQCRRCMQYLPISVFNKDSRTADGFQYWCKSCRKESYRTKESVCIRCGLKKRLYSFRKKRDGSYTKTCKSCLRHSAKKKTSKTKKENVVAREKRKTKQIGGRVHQHCSACGEYKLLNDFPHDKPKPYNRNTICKNCRALGRRSGAYSARNEIVRYKHIEIRGDREEIKELIELIASNKIPRMRKKRFWQFWRR